MRSKLEEWEPTIMAGMYAWRMAYRVLSRYVAVRGRVPLIWLGGLAVIAGAATAGGEALYYWLSFGVDPMRIIDANFTLATRVRPAGLVFALAPAVTLARAIRGSVRAFAHA